jgi:hypothetical protein
MSMFGVYYSDESSNVAVVAAHRPEYHFRTGAQRACPTIAASTRAVTPARHCRVVVFLLPVGRNLGNVLDFARRGVQPRFW